MLFQCLIHVHSSEVSNLWLKLTIKKTLTWFNQFMAIKTDTSRLFWTFCRIHWSLQIQMDKLLCISRLLVIKQSTANQVTLSKWSDKEVLIPLSHLHSNWLDKFRKANNKTRAKCLKRVKNSTCLSRFKLLTMGAVSLLKGSRNFLSTSVNCTKTQIAIMEAQGWDSLFANR